VAVIVAMVSSSAMTVSSGVVAGCAATLVVPLALSAAGTVASAVVTAKSAVLSTTGRVASVP